MGTGFVVLFILWVVGFIAYCSFTKPQTRETVLTFVWIAMLIPSVVFGIIALLR